jgi:signal transduction histidine kinase/CheY-like chemotaxis protein
MQMNLAALVVPGVISGVCVLVGLMTLHEYCAGAGAESLGSAYALPRCFFPSEKLGDSGAHFTAESRVLSYAKIAAVSFYAASFLTTVFVLAFPSAKVGPLKSSLAFYHILICLWSTLYYALDFAELVPLVRSERDGMLEYSAVRVLAVWPVTSTLMISKIAVLSMMTRTENKNRAERVASDAGVESDAEETHVEVEEANDTNDDEDVNGKSLKGKIAANSRLYPFARTFRRLRAAQKRKESDELMSTSWDAWAISLVNNLMLLAGAFGLVADRWLVRVVSMAISCLLFVVIMRGFRELFTQVISRVVHPEDRGSLRALELMTYATWTLFPIIQLLREFRLIDTVTQFMLMTGADIVAKMTYSTMLVFSNFWLINAADGLMRLDERLFTDALEVSRYSQLAARTLEKAKIEAESVSQLHRAFVANISHELRTPLNSIIAFNSLLLEDESLTEAQREFVGSAIVSAEALLGIIGQILDFAKLESGSETHQALVMESFDVDEMMNELVDIVGHQASRNQVEMVVDVDPSLRGLVLRGDKFRLRQALINVANNSVKYTREGGEVRVRIDRLGAGTTVTTFDGQRPDSMPTDSVGALIRRSDERRGNPRREDSGSWLALAGAAAPDPAPDPAPTARRSAAAPSRRNPRRRAVAAGPSSDEHEPRPTATDRPSARESEWLWIRLEVADTGIGIAEDKLGVVFQPFGQASTSSTREYGGAGLGLAITKNIMASLGGHVSCASAVGRGTTMTLDVPLEVPRGSLGSGNSGSKTRAAEAFLLRNAEEVVTAVDKRSLGDAIGRVARAGGAAHSHLDVASRFPHTETQRRVWGKEVAKALQRAHRPHNACVVVLEEAFLAPLFAEWHRAGTLRAGRADVPAIVLVVGRKITVHDPAGEDSVCARTLPLRGQGEVFLSRDGEASRGASRRLGSANAASAKTRDENARARRGRSRLISASIPAPVPALGEDSGADALFGFRNQDSELDVLDFDETWRALLRGAQQVIRPVKPSALRDALRAADAELARRREGSGGDGGGAKRLGTGTVLRESNLGPSAGPSAGPGGPAEGPGARPLRASRLARHSVVDDSHAPNERLPETPRAAAARRRATAAATAPRRVTRSAMRRASAAEITEITEQEITTDVTEENLGENLGGVVFCGRDPAREESREEREEETRVARTARLAEETRGDGGCVLIVEDNLMNQKVAKVVVKRCGMRSDVANNGREAIDALTRGGRYDAILMDIQMPVMDGLDATREIRRLEAAGAIPRAPGGGANFIVAVSANATAENHQEGFEAGMDDYITKPIYPTRLRELLMTPRAR